MTTTYSLTRTTAPTAEPVTLAEARDQCEVIATDTTHDTKLGRYLTAAREQIENDTGYACTTQTFKLYLDSFPNDDQIYIPIRPIQSITSVKYQDTSDVQQTLSTTVYGLDAPRRMVYLKHDQSWPNMTEQHNGIEIELIAGFGAASAVPALIKQAILLQLTKWFVHRGDEMKVPAGDEAYERIKRRISRTSYP